MGEPKRENGINRKYGMSGGNSETPKRKLGREKRKMRNFYISISPQNKGFPNLQGAGPTCGARLRYVGRVQRRNSDRKTETAQTTIRQRWRLTSQAGETNLVVLLPRRLGCFGFVGHICSFLWLLHLKEKAASFQARRSGQDGANCGKNTFFAPKVFCQHR